MKSEMMSDDALLADLSMKVAAELGEILKAYSGVVLAAKRVVRANYGADKTWDDLKNAVAELAEELERATNTKHTSW